MGERQCLFHETFSGGGHTNALRNRGGHRLELKDTNCANSLKLRGGKFIFRGNEVLPQPPPPKN